MRPLRAARCLPLALVLVAAGCRSNGPGNDGPNATGGSLPGAVLVLESPTASFTDERGATATFTVRLAGRPTGPVDVPIGTSAPGEARATPERLTFSVESWDKPQTVTLTGADDAAADGDRDYDVTVGPAASTDARFDGAEAPTMRFVNRDDEIPGLLLDASSDRLRESDKAPTAIRLRLVCPPIGTVEVEVTSSDPSQVAFVGPTRFTFTIDDWNQAREIEVRGVDDEVVDGDHEVQLTARVVGGTDQAYAAALVANAKVISLDDDFPSLVVTPEAPMLTEEKPASGPGPSQANFDVRLATKPRGSVRVRVTSGEPAEVAVDPTTAVLDFDDASWRSPRRVSVTGKDDNVRDGPRPVLIQFDVEQTTDDAYQNVGAQRVVINMDDETAVASPTKTSRTQPLERDRAQSP